MSNLYNKEEEKALNIKRDAYKLKDLLYNIKEEENNLVEKIQQKGADFIYSKIKNFKSSFIIVSKNQVYKTYSLVGIMKNYNKNVKYTILDIAFLLDVWYDHSSLMNKDDILNCNILIIHGQGISSNQDYKMTALEEITSIRTTMHKITWLFLENIDNNKFNETYINVSKYYNRVYFV